MGIYRDEVNMTPHNFNTSTILIDKEYKAEGTEMFEVELDNPTTTVTAVSDGMAILNDSPIRTGKIKIQVLEASPLSNKLWDLYDSNRQFPIQFLDSNAPKFNCGAKFLKPEKPPVEKRAREVDVVEWIFIAPYLKVRGGSYKLVAV